MRKCNGTSINLYTPYAFPILVIVYQPYRYDPWPTSAMHLPQNTQHIYKHLYWLKWNYKIRYYSGYTIVNDISLIFINIVYGLPHQLRQHLNGPLELRDSIGKWFFSVDTRWLLRWKLRKHYIWENINIIDRHGNKNEFKI